MARPWSELRNSVLVRKLYKAIEEKKLRVVNHGDNGTLCALYVGKFSWDEPDIDGCFPHRGQTHDCIVTLRRLPGRASGHNDSRSIYIFTIEQDGELQLLFEEDDDGYIASATPRMVVDFYDLVADGKLRYRG